MIVHQPPVKHSWSQQKLVFLSGLSDPHTCALSQTQQQFLAQLEAKNKVRQNFPYLPEFDKKHPSPNLLAASLANTKQYLLARSAEFRLAATEHWDALAGSCEELFVITLSCGLEIVNSCLIDGIRPRRLMLIALGPVARRRPDVPHRLLAGTSDFIARAFFTRVDIWLPHVGHMNYLQQPEIVDLMNSLLKNFENGKI